MGQKSHPRGLRLGIIEGWDSKWYASHNYAALLHEDLKLRDFIKKRPLSRRHLADRNRADGQQGQDQYSYGAARES